MRILPFSIFLLLQISLFGTPPEPVLPLSKAIYSLDYYKQQGLLWQAEVQLQSKNGQAWLNYYTAARNVNILSGQHLFLLPDIVANLREVLPHSFEAHYLTYWQSSIFDRRYDALLKAYELEPQREEIAFDMLHYYEVADLPEALAAYCESLFQRGLLSNGILDWNYNALASVRRNGILLTQAENDTYPAWVLQKVKGVRPDVRVVNTPDLLANAAYRQNVFQELDIPAFQRNILTSPDEQLQALLLHISQHAKRPLHLGVATPAHQRSSLDGELYLTGLAFEFSSVYLDNLTILQHNFEDSFLTEQLEHDLHYSTEQTIVDHMNLNYLPALALLHEMYKGKRNEMQAERVQTIAYNIADKAGRLAQISPFFALTPLNAPDETKLDLRAIEKTMKPIGPNVYASSFEVSRSDYGAFLVDLEAEGHDELLEVCQIHPTDWRSFLPEEYQDLPEELLFEIASPNDADVPVVNISHDAAVQYCEWLTIAYNTSTHRRKQFEEVRFRLPTATEWEIAARAGQTSAPYPWSGPYTQNAKGCYLSNFNPYLVSQSDGELLFGPVEDGESPGVDGAFFPVPVDSYLPNDFGLYNIAGNVSEMINIPGQTRGGGWQDPDYFTQIGVTKKEDTPGANVGFRIFMTVIKA